MMLTALMLALTLSQQDPVPWISLPGGETALEVYPAQILLEGGGMQTVLEWPVVAGEADDPAVEAINDALSWEAVTGQSLEETMAIFADIQRGYTGAGYTVNFDEGGILDITITTEFIGAYMSTERRFFCFDASTGGLLSISDLLADSRKAELVGILDAMLQENIEAAKEIYCNGPDDPGCDMYSGYEFTEEYLDRFSIVEDGIWFHYDFGFPHVALAAQPEGELFLSAAEMEPFLAR
jgi:hypothetical protein